MTRGFKIYNSNGDMIDLLNNLDFFSINPEGLGVSFDNEYHESNSNFLLDSSKVSMGQFKIDILFGAVTGESYERYDDLLKLLNAPPYRLVYETSVGVWNRTCKLNELSKTEIKELNIMVESITLDMMTPWYVDVEESYVPTPEQDGDGKIYKEDIDSGDPAIFNTPPLSGYSAGDIWKWDSTQYWPGMNYVKNTPTPGGASLPLLNNLNQGVGATYSLSDGNVIITKTSKNGTSTGFNIGSTVSKQPQEYLDLIGGRTIYAKVKNLKASKMELNPTLGLSYWDEKGVIKVILQPYNPDGDITEIQVDLPSNITNIMLAVRFKDPGAGDPGDWISFGELSLQSENPVFERNPIDFVGANEGTLTTDVGRTMFSFNDWHKSNSVFNNPPDSSYGIGDIWNWKEGQTWNSMNKLCVADLVYGFIDSAGLITNDTKDYLLTPLMPVNSKFYLLGNRTTPLTKEFVIRMAYYNAAGSFIARALLTYPAGTAANHNLPKEQNAPAGTTQIRLCIDEDSAKYIGVSNVDKWSTNPSDYLEKRKAVKLTAISPNSVLDFNDWVEYEEEDPSQWVSPFIYNDSHYYDYIYGNGDYGVDTGRYNYTYDYVYEGKANGDDGVFMIDNDSRYLGSTKGSPIEITINGPAVNPYWYVIVGSEILQSDGYNVTLGIGDKLVVSSVPTEQRATIVSIDGKTSNVYQQQVLSYTNFVTIPSGKSQLVFYNCKDVDYKFRKESVIV